MFGWHPRLDGHKFEQAPGIGDGQGRLCCSPWSLKELDMILSKLRKMVMGREAVRAVSVRLQRLREDRATELN